MGKLVHQQQPQLPELILIFPWHSPDQGALAVHHLVVGQGQDIVLGKGVAHGEGHLVVVPLAE